MEVSGVKPLFGILLLLVYLILGLLLSPSLSLSFSLFQADFRVTTYNKQLSESRSSTAYLDTYILKYQRRGIERNDKGLEGWKVGGRGLEDEDEK